MTGAEGFDFDEFWRRANEATRSRVLPTAQAAIDVFGEFVIGDSQQLTPVATGFLQGSGTTEPAELKGQEIGKTIGHDAEYAAAVHEREDVHHTVGQAGFLRESLLRNSSKFGPFIANKIKDALG